MLRFRPHTVQGQRRHMKSIGLMTSLGVAGTARASGEGLGAAAERGSVADALRILEAGLGRGRHRLVGLVMCDSRLSCTSMVTCTRMSNKDTALRLSPL